MFILASKSPRRVKLLKQAGFDFISCPPNVNEEEISAYLYPPFTPIKLAYAKVEKVALLHPNKLVVGSDTIISFQDKVIGKPKTKDEAKQILLTLSDKTHQVITGVCIVRLIDNILCTFAETSFVTFKQLNSNIIDRYISKVNVLDKAGAYAIQEYGDMIIKNIKGSRNNIIGLPSEKLLETFKILL